MTEHTGKEVGKQLGNYRLQRLLGTGGFADVYLGEHLHLGTLAAIKILHTKLAGEEAELFLQEARLIARLSHPHIIRVFDFDVTDMTPFLVMDYAPGGTLRQRHPKKTQVPLASIIEYVKQIADGLQYAHEQRLVHRDIKPENMLIGQRGNVVISDFGVASVAHSTESQTIVELAGTLPYIAPEQLQGLPRPASDQYALAVVVYEWISGERPFQGTFAEIVSQHMVKLPPPLYGRFPEVSPAIESVIFKAMAKEPRDRFATIREFATALELAFKGEMTLFHYQTRLPSTESSNVTGLEIQPMITAHIDATPDLPTISQETYSNTPSGATPATIPGQMTAPSERVVPAEQPSAPHQSYFKQRWKLVAFVVPLLLILISGGTLYALQHTSQPGRATASNNTPGIAGTVQQPSPTMKATSTTAPITPTPTIDKQATVAAQQAVAATQTAAAQVSATQAAATQTAIAQATVTAEASTPQGLYSVVTAQPPSFSDSLAAQSSRTWDTSTNCAFSGGNYVLNAPAGHFINCIAQGTSNLCNLAYQVHMTTISGDGGGLVFRHASNEYRLRVGPDGSYDLVNDSYSVTSGSSAAIHKGLNITNQLTIIAQGSKINLYVNAQFVTSVNDKTASCGSIGLMTVGFGSDARATFSDAKVWLL